MISILKSYLRLQEAKHFQRLNCLATTAHVNRKKFLTSLKGLKVPACSLQIEWYQGQLNKVTRAVKDWNSELQIYIDTFYLITTTS